MSAWGWVGVALALLAALGWCWLLREAVRDFKRKRQEMDAIFDRIFAEMRAIDERDGDR